MAHDSEIDSWDLRQADFPTQTLYRNDPRTLPVTESNRRQQRRRVRRSGSDVRFINPAIYAESLDATEEPGSKFVIEADLDDSTNLARQYSSLSINGEANDSNFAGDEQTGQNTYRCQSITSPTTPSTVISSRVNSKSSVRVRCCDLRKYNEEESNNLPDEAEVQRYALNGHRVVEFSGSSLSSINLSEHQGSTNGLQNEKKKAYEEWIEKKKNAALQRKEEARRLEEEKQSEEQRLEKEREERERRERENFLRWAERKKKEEASKREAIERELEFERRLKEVEDNASVMAKTICLRQWARKKEEQQKALQKKQEFRQKRIDDERKKRLEESSKAYEKWRETSKNKPRPATQGLLPHQKATPSYINPNPWVAADDESTERQKNQSSTDIKKMGSVETKSSDKKSIHS